MSFLCPFVLWLFDFIFDECSKQGGHKPGKPGMLRDFSEHGKLREFLGNSVQPQGKIMTNKVYLVHHSNICVKQLLKGFVHF